MKKIITIPASTTDTIVTIDIPDPVSTYTQASPVATVAPPVITTTQSDPIITISGGTPSSTSTTTTATPSTGKIDFTVVQIPYSDPDFLRPNTGAKMFYNALQKVPVPTDSNPTALDNEKRFNWTEMQLVRGQYNWAKFDQSMNGCIDKNQKFSFGIGMVSNGYQYDGAIQIGSAYSGYPQFVHDDMQAESVKDWIPTTESSSPKNQWVPNWNSPSMMASWKVFLAALNDHILTTSYKGILYKNAISLVHLAGYGLYGGEWHTAGAGRDDPNTGARKATVQTLINFIDAYRTTFNDWPLVLPINAFAGSGNGEIPSQVGYYGLTAKNNWGLFGWSSFHIGSNEDYAQYDIYKNTNQYNGVAFKPLLLDRYKYAPISGEPMNSESSQTTGGVQFALMEKQVRDYGITNFNNSFTYTSLNTTGLSNFRNATKASGYRLSIVGGSISDSSLILNWSNSGIAPAYENWDVYYEIRDTASKVLWSGKSSFSPTLFLPGTKIVTDTVSNMKGSLYVIVKDPTGYRKPLPLANKNRLLDGSYLIVTIK